MEINKAENKLWEICGDVNCNLCLKCVMYLCESCFKFIHDKSKNKNHKNENIESFVLIPLKCSFHPKDRINLFCLDEKSKNI